MFFAEGGAGIAGEEGERATGGLETRRYRG